MFKKVLLSLSAAALVFAGASQARADVLTAGGGPVGFSFGGVGSGASGNPYTFTGPATLTVLDGFLDGDQFSVSDGATLLGVTSVPANDGGNCGGTYATCLADARFSRGVYNLGGGAHSITITTTLSPYGAGGAFVELDAATAAGTPEPSSLALLGTGLVGVVGSVRRRFKK